MKNVVEENEFAVLAEPLRTDFLAELLDVSRQMIYRYRTEGAPERQVERLKEYLSGLTQS